MTTTAKPPPLDLQEAAKRIANQRGITIGAASRRLAVELGIIEGDLEFGPNPPPPPAKEK